MDTLFLLRIFISMIGVCSVVQFILTLTTNLISSMWFFMGCFWVMLFMAVPVSMTMGPLYMEKMKKNSGTAAAIQTCSTNLGGAVLAHFMTYIIAPYGARGMNYTSSACIFGAVALFWVGFGVNPPSWAR